MKKIEKNYFEKKIIEKQKKVTHLPKEKIEIDKVVFA